MGGGQSVPGQVKVEAGLAQVAVNSQLVQKVLVECDGGDTSSLKRLLEFLQTQESSSMPEDPADRKEKDAAATKLQSMTRGRAAKADMAVEVNEETLSAVFYTFAAYGKRGAAVSELEARNFIKMLKETGVIGKKLNTNDCDMIFKKCIDKGAKKMKLSQWKTSLGLIAQKKGCDVEKIKKVLVMKGTPAHGNATRSEANRFYDDKSNWTATAKNGGPEKFDTGAAPTLASQANRDNKADARGVVA
jgi:hypothetical protein